MNRNRPRWITAALVSLVVLVAPLTGCAALDELIDLSIGSGEETRAPIDDGSTSQPEYPTAPVQSDYYTVLGPAEITYQVTEAGVVSYCPLDERGRTVCAYGELTSTLRQQAQQADRQDINVDPSGWPRGPVSNTEVVIPALPGVENSTDYSGWFWNRSHLVADSLGGDAVVENLVTGTRTQNVGSHQEQGQYAGGMAYTELKARNYLDSGAGDACPLYYAATPIYQDDELIPRVVIVDIQSCDQSIDQRVEVSNTANGYEIDYFNGEFAPPGQ